MVGSDVSDLALSLVFRDCALDTSGGTTALTSDMNISAVSLAHYISSQLDRYIQIQQ